MKYKLCNVAKAEGITMAELYKKIGDSGLEIKQHHLTMVGPDALSKLGLTKVLEVLDAKEGIQTNKEKVDTKTEELSPELVSLQQLAKQAEQQRLAAPAVAVNGKRTIRQKQLIKMYQERPEYRDKHLFFADANESRVTAAGAAFPVIDHGTQVPGPDGDLMWAVDKKIHKENIRQIVDADARRMNKMRKGFAAMHPQNVSQTREEVFSVEVVNKE